MLTEGPGSAAEGDHDVFEVPGLGLTMADGGERISPLSNGKGMASRKPKRPD